MSIKNNRGVWLTVGILLGLFIGSMLPNAPLHASATHGTESFAIATGEIDVGLEGVYFLDMVTGDLTGFILNPTAKTFTTTYSHNVLGDFGRDLKNPKFLMVTGHAELRQGSQPFKVARSVIYIAEMTSGTFATYGVPYQPNRPAGEFKFLPIAKGQFRKAAIRQ